MTTGVELPFLSINFYHSVFFAVLMVITIGLFVYKTEKYPFPRYAVSMSGVLLALFAATHYMRYRLAKASVSQKQAKKIIMYMVVTVFMIPLYVFQLRLQTYVLLIDWVLNWIGIGLTIAEVLTGAWVFWALFKKTVK